MAVWRKIAVITAILPATIAAQIPSQDREWTTWTKQSTEKVLNNSPWGRTQTETDTSEMFFTPTKPGTASVGLGQAAKNPTGDQQSVNNNRADRGATNQVVSVNYHVRLLSAKPIREALSRMLVLSPDVHVEGLEDTMQTFVDRDFAQFIVVTVTYDSNDGRYSGPATQAFSTASTETLKNSTYLERSDGKKLYLMEYRAPVGDGLGAKFAFPRMVNGKAFLTKDFSSLRFFSDLGQKIKLNVKFKSSEMMLAGRLEY